MVKSWIVKEQSDPIKVAELATSLGIDAVLANLLVQRGVTSYDEAKAFFRPSLDDLHDPFLLTDMDKAVERLHRAMENNEKILVYGDYDVDGTTAVALMYSFLKPRYNNVSYYIPDRYSEGYGVSYKSVEYAAENGFTLFITLDCGIKAVEKVAHAKELGIEFIICDHHFPGRKFPTLLPCWILSVQIACIPLMICRDVESVLNCFRLIVRGMIFHFASWSRC